MKHRNRLRKYGNTNFPRRKIRCTRIIMMPAKGNCVYLIYTRSVIR